MATLRKRDKKREKLRAEALVRKKKRLTEEVIISGPKRGAGRRKRKRLITSTAKLAEFKKRMAGKDAAKAT
jgi:signal recognition particle subunit SRP14